jgi:hypothetical protein
LAGVAPHPDRDVYLELGRRIQLDGGKILSPRCTPTRLQYPEAVSDEARRTAEHDAETCGCGDTRKVMIRYEHALGDDNADGTPRTVERRYVACVNCDAVALQPRWTQGRWAPGQPYPEGR